MSESSTSEIKTIRLSEQVNRHDVQASRKAGRAIIPTIDLVTPKRPLQSAASGQK